MLEAITNQLPCQDFFYETTQAVDNRYESVSGSLLIQPNEYDIQETSGVLETLETLPYFLDEIGDPEILKSQLYYDLWVRTTLEYDVNCGTGSVSSAVGYLEDIH